jgi:hypothetical protein
VDLLLLLPGFVSPRIAERFIDGVGSGEVGHG